MHCQNESLSVGSITYFLDTASRLTALSQGEISTNDRARACPRKKIIFTRTQFSDGGRSVTPSTYTLRTIFSYVTSNVESIRRRIRFNEMFRRLILQPCEILFYENLRMIEIYSRNVVVSAIIPITITVLCFLVLRLDDYRYLLVLSH